MKRIGILGCATFALGLLAPPLAAQEVAQAALQAQQLPPPPPMPPMPSSRHRWVDMGDPTSRARSKASPARHASSPKRDSKVHASSKSRPNRKTATSHKTAVSHKARTSHKASKSKTAASHRAVREDKVMHFSAKTVRSCHAMSYRQIMRSSSCRAMIKQELAAPAPKHRTSHKASAKHKAAAHSKKTRSHSTAKRRHR